MKHLNDIVRLFLIHFHQERPHQSRDNFPLCYVDAEEPRILKFSSGPDARARFEDEARLAGHPGIVRVYGVGHEGGFQYIASELCNDPDLSCWLRTQTEPLPRRAAATVALRISQAVAESSLTNWRK